MSAIDLEKGGKVTRECFTFRDIPKLVVIGNLPVFARATSMKFIAIPRAINYSVILQSRGTFSDVRLTDNKVEGYASGWLRRNSCEMIL